MLNLIQTKICKTYFIGKYIETLFNLFYGIKSISLVEYILRLTNIIGLNVLNVCNWVIFLYHVILICKTRSLPEIFEIESAICSICSILYGSSYQGQIAIFKPVLLYLDKRVESMPRFSIASCTLLMAELIQLICLFW